MVTSNAVVGVVGAATIFTALFAVIAIESRSGPTEHDLRPVTLALVVEGRYHASPGSALATAPDGSCVPVPPAGECIPPRIEVDLRIRGLPAAAADLRYVVSLAGPDVDALPLGSLDEEDDVHTLRHGEDRDGAAYAHLVVQVTAAGAPAATAPVLYQKTVGPGTTDEPVPLTETRRAQTVAGSGHVTVDQTGAVTVSALVSGVFEGLSVAPGLEYRAWFIEGAGRDARYTALGPLAFAEDGIAVLDARVERVEVTRQDAFLVTLGSEASGAARPGGLPVFHTPL